MPNLRKICFEGIGTYWECELLEDITVSKHNHIKNCLISRLNEFSESYSRFNKDSLISLLNRSSQILRPSAELRGMMYFARDMFNSTDGVFNISVAGTLGSMGYGKNEHDSILRSDFWERVQISADKLTIPANTSIDFGGFGKGWLIDDFVKIMSKNNVQQFIINGGGDLYVKSLTPIETYLEHPMNSSQKIGSTRILEGALAASSTIKRSWSWDGQIRHHIIDPTRDISSDSGVIASFVRAERALMADVMATVLIVRPELNVRLSERYNLRTILLSENNF